MTYDESADFDEKRKYLSDLVQMLELNGLGLEGWSAVEIGGEGGVLAGLMSRRARHVISTDIEVPQAKHEGRFLPLLREKFQRNGERLPLEKVEFLRADAQCLPFRDDWFDFCFSQNAFEHIPDPEKALREAIRVTRPGGCIYVMFDPLWTADSGSHFQHFIGEPWLHLIEDDEAVTERMRANGATDPEIDSYRHHMNRKPISYYRQMFPRVLEELEAEVLIHHEWSGCADPSFAEHPNRLRASEKLGLSPDDLLVRGMRYLIRAKNA